MDHFLNNSITPKIAEMIGQANKNRKTKPIKSTKSAHLTKSKNSPLEKKVTLNQNLKRYEGI